MSKLVAKKALEQPLAAVIAIIRTSGGVSDKETCAHYHQRAKKLIEALVHEHQQHHGSCDCFPDDYAIFLRSVSSNLDMSRLNEPGLNELRGILNMMLARNESGRIEIVILQNDGLTTNAVALREFFKPYASLDLWLCIQYYDSAIEHPITSFIASVDDWERGAGGDTFCHGFVRILIGVSVNKEIMKQANIGNKTLGLKPRNLMIKQQPGIEYQSLNKPLPKTFDPAASVHHHTSITFLRATGEWAHIKLTEEEKTDAIECAKGLLKRIKTRKNVDKCIRATRHGDTMGHQQHKLPSDPVTGDLRCLEYPACQKTFGSDIDALIRHLVETINRLPDRQRMCYMCDKLWTRNGDRRYVDDHLRKHFPPQLQCTKCDWLGRTETDIVLHVQSNDECEGGLPDRQFLHVSPEHRLYVIGDAEHMDNKYQTADAAGRTAASAIKKRVALRQIDPVDWETETQPKILYQSSFECVVCTLSFDSLSAAKEHMKDSHSLKISCGGCGAVVAERA